MSNQPPSFPDFNQPQAPQQPLFNPQPQAGYPNPYSQPQPGLAANSAQQFAANNQPKKPFGLKRLIVALIFVALVTAGVLTFNVINENNRQEIYKEGIQTVGTPVTVTKHNPRRGADYYTANYLYVVDGQPYNVHGHERLPYGQTTTDDVDKVTVFYMEDDPSRAAVNYDIPVDTN